MTLNPRFFANMAVAAAAALSLAACASHPPPPPAPPVPPPEQGGPPPQQTYQAPQQPASGPAPGTVQDFVINVGDRVYFDFNEAQIRADAAPVLDGQAAWLRHYGAVRVRIDGNCDERGTREYNFALGARRADAIRDYLIRHGVDAGRITTISYGKERPIDPGHDEAAWAKDRNGHTDITEGAR
jgi:peptidoglycan-associated lipoprotein